MVFNIALNGYKMKIDELKQKGLWEGEREETWKVMLTKP